MDHGTLIPYHPTVNIRTVDTGGFRQLPRENDHDTYMGNMLALSASGLSIDDKIELAKRYGVTPEIIHKVMNRMDKHNSTLKKSERFVSFRVKEIIESFV